MNENLTTFKYARVSKSLQHFKTRFLKCFNLVDYNQMNTVSCLFYGCYNNENDRNAILRHLNIGVIIWGGSDIKFYKDIYLNKSKNITKNIKRRLKNKTLRKFIRDMKSKRNLFHLAISSDIKQDLDMLDIPSRRIKFNLSDSVIFRPISLGKCVYVYTSENRPETYGQSIISSIKRKLHAIEEKEKDSVTTFIERKIDNANERESYENMPKLYATCFIGLRLTKHDGNANTVQELGLMGRYCVHNGENPNCIEWKTEDDVINAILREKQKIGMTNLSIAKKVKEFLETDNNWLYLSYYE